MAKKTKTYEFFDYDCDLTHRIIWLGAIDTSSTKKTIKALYLMNADAPNGDKPITVILNSPGGDWYAGMSIYSAIKKSANPVTVRVSGWAASMGTVILQAAAHRVMEDEATLMIHSGSNSFEGHSKSFHSWAEEDKRISGIMHRIYLEKIQEKHPDFRLKKLEEMLHFDKWLTAEQTLELGLIDEVV